MKKIIMKSLATLARLIVKKYKPKVIGITGSVGKTSTKEMLSNVLANKFRVRSSIKNYNNEFGLPLTIIGLESPGKNIFGWLKIFFEAEKLLLFKDASYPEVLVLEMGIDREGDMDYLLSIVRPDIGVLTNISHSHIEYLGSLEKIKKEKTKLLHGLKKDGVAIFNFDNKYLKDLKKELKTKSYSYGLEEGADFLAKDVNFNIPADFSLEDECGINFKLQQGGAVLPVYIPQAISLPQVYSALVSLTVAHSLGMNLIEISSYLKNIKSLPGRMNIIPGIKKSIIVDDTYNASPESTISALNSISHIKLKDGARKIAVLGDMLELGHYSEEGHRLVGEKALETGINVLFLIGERARDIGRGAIAKGFLEDNVFYFSKTEDSLELLKERINSGDLVLVKASQGGRLEKVVKEIMAEPNKAAELLVRQGKGWE